MSSARGTPDPDLRKASRPWLIHAILVVCAALSIVPFVWMVLISFKPLNEVEMTTPFPRQWHPANYGEVFRQIPFAHYYFNSVFIAAWITFLVVYTSALAAYAFARMKWSGRDAVFRLYLATMMIPGLVTMIPNYSLMVRLHLLDSYQGLIVPAAFSAFGTFMLRQFMLSIHPALDESAEIDGASHWSVFWNVIMPLCRPGLVTLAIFTFMGAYGSFFWPLVMIKSDYLRTLPIGLMYFDSVYDTETNHIMAASVMSLVPLVLLFLIGQRFFVRGIMLGSVKG